MAFSWKNIVNPFGIGEDAEDEIKKGYANANATIENAKKNMKSASQLQQEGRAVAGQAAADKAGIAKRQATAAAKMSNVGKLAAATKGAAAAQNASEEGYSEAAAAGTNTANQIQQQQLALANQQAQNQIAEGQQKADNINKKKERGSQFASGVMSLFSDKNVKSFKKHTYIKREER